MHFEEQPDVLTPVEAARLLRLGRNSVYDAIARGEVPAVRVGRRLLVPKAALQRLLACAQPDTRVEKD